VKVVVNSSFGDFRLSHEAIMRFAEMKGVPLYLYVWRSHCSPYEVYDPAVHGDRNSDGLEYFTEVYDPTIPPHAWYAMKMDWQVKHYNWEKFRTDPDLITLVETMGDRFNGSESTCATLVNIPDDVMFDIVFSDEDDCELIVEKHRVWSPKE
jgi:hypothetical protein